MVVVVNRDGGLLEGENENTLEDKVGKEGIMVHLQWEKERS